jgi:LmbE family N-acetylglucosaminyl deacetylase
MNILELPAPGSFDCLYVSPQADVAARSCGQRIDWETSRGLRVLVVDVFGEPAASVPDGAPRIPLGIPAAPMRHAGYASLRARVEDRVPEDERALDRAAVLLDEVARRTRAVHIYAPLGVGGDIDHRLAHDAALRAFRAAAGRNVFFYEERPQRAVPGAVRLRLASIGAQLPPQAANAVRRTGKVRFLVRFLLSSHVRRQGRGLSDRVAGARAAARQWKAARAWRPLRALGPRLQPVEQEVAPSGVQRFWLLVPGKPSPGVVLEPEAVGL